MWQCSIHRGRGLTADQSPPLIVLCGILCLVMLSLQNLSTVSRIDLIISGKIRRLFTIFVRRFTEPETAVKFQFDRFRELRIVITGINCMLRTGICLSPNFLYVYVDTGQSAKNIIGGAAGTVGPCARKTSV